MLLRTVLPFKNRYDNIPRARKGNEKSATFTLKPNVATIQAVKVVPKLAPKITPSAFFRLIIPAPRNARISKFTIELLCKIPVTKVPVKIPFQLRLVNFLRRFLNDLPARPLMPSSR